MKVCSSCATLREHMYIYRYCHTQKKKFLSAFRNLHQQEGKEQQQTDLYYIVFLCIIGLHNEIKVCSPLYNKLKKKQTQNTKMLIVIHQRFRKPETNDVIQSMVSLHQKAVSVIWRTWTSCIPSFTLENLFHTCCHVLTCRYRKLLISRPFLHPQLLISTKQSTVHMEERRCPLDSLSSVSAFIKPFSITTIDLCASHHC